MVTTATQTPEWRAPTALWARSYLEAAEVGVPVFAKENLYRRDRGFPGAAGGDPQPDPVFDYLSAKSADEVVHGEVP